MNEKTKARAGALICAAAGAGFCLALAPAAAQDAPRAPSTSAASDPSPYYLGVSQGLTHDSNVYRIPSGPSDNYSSTSLFGGFDQPISRQRVFGRGNVTVNRYQDQSQLNNTSYDLAAGADLATIENISGNLNFGLTRSLAAPAATVNAPNAIRNVLQTQRVDARARWGGPALLSVEGSLGYVKVDYSAPQYVASNSDQESASLGLYYRPGAALRLGVAGRFVRTRTPKALFDPLSGSYQSNTIDGSNLDLLAEYVYSSALRTNARLSYTRQTNSSISSADFSGLTGSVGVVYQPTAKTSVQFDASRDAGYEASPFTRYAAVQTGTGVTLSPVAALYENNRVTDSVGLGLSYAATAKITASARLRYSRARLASSIATQAASADTVDEFKGVSLGADYAITRNWAAACNLSHETRAVSGAVAFSYKANTVGCSTQFIWR